MKIAVISPHAEHCGRTTLSILLGLELAKSHKKVCMCHTKPIAEEIYTYMGFNKFEDKTSQPSQIVKMLKEGDINKDSMSDYCKFVNRYFDIFTNRSTNLTADDMEYMTEYILDSFPYEHIIVDIDNLNSEANKKIIKKCDAVVLCITQSASEADAFFNIKDKYLDLIAYERNGKTFLKPVITVVNKYNSVKSTQKELAKWMHLTKPNNWLVLHENPWIEWGENHGKLETVHRLANKGDARALVVGSDISKIATKLAQAKNSSNHIRK